MSGTPVRLRQILFVPPAPLVWAEHLGSFAPQDIDVETTQTLSSDQLGQGLAEGTWDVGIAVMDNVIAWNQDVAPTCASSRSSNARR